jgi:hypothetical protein
MQRLLVIVSCVPCLLAGCSGKTAKTGGIARGSKGNAPGPVVRQIVGPLGLHDVEAFRGNGFQIEVPRSWRRERLSEVSRLRATGRAEKAGPPYQSWSGEILVQHTPLSSVFPLDNLADLTLRALRMKSFAERRNLKLANGAEALFVSWDVPAPAGSQTRIVKYMMWVKIKSGGRWHLMGTLQATGDDPYVARDGAADKAMKRCLLSLTF